MSNTSLQFFCLITLRYFPIKVYVFWISIEFFLCLRCNWNKQGGISWFKNEFDFFTSNNKSPQFYFFQIKVTPQYSSYFCLKRITKIFLKNVWLTTFCKIRHKASNFCQTLSNNRNYSIFTKNVEKRWQCFEDMTFGNR